MVFIFISFLLFLQFLSHLSSLSFHPIAVSLIDRKVVNNFMSGEFYGEESLLLRFEKKKTHNLSYLLDLFCQFLFDSWLLKIIL